MKTHAINRIPLVLICLFLLLNFQKSFAQAECPYNGETEFFFIPPGLADLNDILYPPSSRVENNNLIVTTNWTFINGPIGPRGPRTVSLSDDDGDGDDDDTDFPNTGAGPDEPYIFEHTVSEYSCNHSSQITFWIEINNSSSEGETIYICPGEKIEDANELFNAFSMSQIRDISNDWVDSQFNPLVYNDYNNPVREGLYD